VVLEPATARTNDRIEHSLRANEQLSPRECRPILRCALHGRRATAVCFLSCCVSRLHPSRTAAKVKKTKESQPPLGPGREPVALRRVGAAPSFRPCVPRVVSSKIVHGGGETASAYRRRRGTVGSALTNRNPTAEDPRGRGPA